MGREAMGEMGREAIVYTEGRRATWDISFRGRSGQLYYEMAGCLMLRSSLCNRHIDQLP